MNGLSALIKGTLESCHTLLPLREHTERRWPSMNQKQAQSQTPPFGALIAVWLPTEL